MVKVKFLILLNVFILLFVLSISINSAGARFEDVFKTKVGTPQDEPGSGPTCNSHDYEACLEKQFNITLNGDTRKEYLKIIFDGLALGLRYPTFLSLYKKAHITIKISTYSICGQDPNCTINPGAWASVNGSTGNLTLYRNVFERASTRFQHSLLVHEAGHVVALTNQGARMQNHLYHYAFDLNKDRNCFSSSGVIKTYSPSLLGKNKDPKRRVRETWAESVADSILCKSDAWCQSNGTDASSIWDFPSSCSYIYNYVRGELR